MAHHISLDSGALHLFRRADVFNKINRGTADKHKKEAIPQAEVYKMFDKKEEASIERR
ncbi:hypothetical protein ACFQMJ_31575 [Cohnella cellulosilytica]|uniref:Uncharacterized protein n=1 Tax=Cohnella cellulosilytica TaxID=986710 RepID=A0ABW2FNQ8_9BACL